MTVRVCVEIPLIYSNSELINITSPAVKSLPSSTTNVASPAVKSASLTRLPEAVTVSLIYNVKASATSATPTPGFMYIVTCLATFPLEIFAAVVHA